MSSAGSAVAKAGRSSTSARVLDVVTYKVSGDARTAIGVGYAAKGGASTLVTAPRLPWSVTVTMRTPIPTYVLTAAAFPGTQVTCEIDSDGRVLDRATSTGTSDEVACSAQDPNYSG